MDEKATGRGQDYIITVVSDLDASTVEHIADERRRPAWTATSPGSAPSSASGSRRWPWTCGSPTSFRCGAHLTGPDNKIVFDRYHVMGYLGTAVDTVRKREHRALAKAGDTTLAGSKYLWLYSAENLPERHVEWFASLRAVDLKTGRAWAIKENLRRLWNYRRRGWGERHPLHPAPNPSTWGIT